MRRLSGIDTAALALETDATPLHMMAVLLLDTSALGAGDRYEDIRTFLSSRIAAMRHFELLSDGSAIPVFAFRVKPRARFSVFDLSDKLRERGWQVPAYTMPAKIEDIAVLRIVVREGFSRDMATMLLDDLARAVDHFSRLKGHVPKRDGRTFRH